LRFIADRVTSVRKAYLKNLETAKLKVTLVAARAEKGLV
jgi:hypothetical protein